jgi:hypothetical protein
MLHFNKVLKINKKIETLEILNRKNKLGKLLHSKKEKKTKIA